MKLLIQEDTNDNRFYRCYRYPDMENPIADFKIIHTLEGYAYIVDGEPFSVVSGRCVDDFDTAFDNAIEYIGEGDPDSICYSVLN